MKSLSQYMTESLLNEGIASEIQKWADDYWVASPNAVKKSVKNDLKSTLQDLSTLSSELATFTPTKNQKDAELATLNLANYVASAVIGDLTSDAIEEWMDIVGGDWASDPAVTWLSGLYDRIKKDSKGRCDPMAELA